MADSEYQEEADSEHREESEPDFSDKSRSTAGNLGIILGLFGAHRFYLGYNNIGKLQIVVTILTLGVGGLWGIYEGITILWGSEWRDSEGRLLRPSTK
ncbi:MAG: TM2 domain-containing protein [Chloroflexi bacterium]|nr:TM2 domain-containing protein [Chloroflexota bacterium]